MFAWGPFCLVGSVLCRSPAVVDGRGAPDDARSFVAVTTTALVCSKVLEPHRPIREADIAAQQNSAAQQDLVTRSSRRPIRAA
jgi:hypothetical protein